YGIFSSEGDLAKLKELVAKQKYDINQVDKCLGSPLHIACAAGYVQTVQFLVESKAMLNQRDKQNRSPLMKAVQGQHETLHLTAKMASVNMAHLLLLYDMAEFLLQEGADVNTIDVNKRSLLMMAAENGQVKMLQLLLQNEADVTLQDNKGLTAKDYARKKKHNPCSFIFNEYTTQKTSR
uniref:Si:ch211-272n13.3 n=1 Tax=Neogobius melanostomus TaxID=47308 RepID=A0A8C6T2R4_9GOBI